ncbi:hypothetical protein [Leptolyngbya ohadii]|uniref:hypothetical protein n=1 Tax=Leptolyngbya ohadii TaxID=1962290 RepID=UPI000B59C2C9|nr:hypothetical protein [Leptolyngbya ohadii]
MLWIAQLGEFNEYDDLNIIDCDRDLETAFGFFFALLWLTTLLIWAINLILKYGSRTKPFWSLGGLSAFLSIAFIPKIIELIQYSADLDQRCPK